MLFQLWVGQSSECFRRLALLLSPRRIEELDEGEASATPAPLLHRAIFSVIKPLQIALDSCLNEVQRSYDFHRHFETHLRTTGSDRMGRAREKCRELNALHTSIRSLQLHLKALLSEWDAHKWFAQVGVRFTINIALPLLLKLQDDHPGGWPGETDGVQRADRVDLWGLPGD